MRYRKGERPRCAVDFVVEERTCRQPRREELGKVSEQRCMYLFAWDDWLNGFVPSFASAASRILRINKELAEQPRSFATLNLQRVLVLGEGNSQFLHLWWAGIISSQWREDVFAGETNHVNSWLILTVVQFKYQGGEYRSIRLPETCCHKSHYLGGCAGLGRSTNN